MPQLVFSQKDRSVFRVRLQKSSTKIGRSENCDVVLTEPEVSREHAVIYFLENKYFIKRPDGKTISINGEEKENHVLAEGDAIKIGPWEAVFQAEEMKRDPAEETMVTQVSDVKTQSVAMARGGVLVKEWALQIQVPNQPPKTLKLSSAPVTLGADTGNDLVYDDPFLSSRHLKVVLMEDSVWVYDLASTNGTFVNGVKIREAQWEPGQVVKAGQIQLSLVEEGHVESVQPVETELFFGLIGKTKVMQDLYGTLARLGPADATVLVLGESGSGKELVSRAIHQLSKRRDKPFVALNCSALSRELIESELFGHEKGAFTGANRQHDGAFAQATGGTLFLDEIGELPLDLQPKLLRVLENKTFRRVGGEKDIPADVRVVAATHRDMGELVKAKKFREDLFFRLFVLPVSLAPLWERKDDLPLLVGSFLKEFSTPGAMKKLSPEALEKLKGYSFPGNVRELRNILLRSVVLAPNEEISAEEIVFIQEFSPDTLDQPPSISKIERLEDMEKEMIRRALEKNNGNKTKTAEALGIAKSTLFAKIKLYDLNGKDG